MTDERGRVVYVNGRLLPAERATISVFDRGFLYGDGLFETVRSYDGEVFALNEHLERLERSARVLGMDVPDVDWPTALRKLLERNRLQNGDAAIRLTLTRGAGEPNLLPPPGLRPTVVIMARPIEPNLTALQRRGVAVTLLPFDRDGFLAEHKVVDYLPGILGRMMAARRRCFEGLYVGSDQLVREGTTTSLFLVRRGRLLTVPVQGVLPGVTRRFILQLAALERIPVDEKPLTVEDLRQSDEAFLTSAVVEVLPVVRIDRQPLASGRPGALTRRLREMYQAVARGAKLAD